MQFEWRITLFSKFIHKLKNLYPDAELNFHISFFHYKIYQATRSDKHAMPVKI